LRGIPPWTSLADVRPAPGWIEAPVTALKVLADVMEILLPPISNLVEQVLALPAYAASALVLALSWWATYRLGRWAFWEPWDRRARDDVLRRAAAAARERAPRAATRAALRPPTGVE
jgi:hypothetical protein